MTRSKWLCVWTVLVALIIAVPVVSQPINETDTRGRKQGEWVMKTPEGKLVYEGTFVDDKPVGLFKRYYEDGSLKAEMDHRSDAVVYARLFYEGKNPVLMAEGKYLNQQKDSVWISYDPSGQRKALDTYRKGIQEGRAVVYHINGEISEEVTFVNDKRHGEWKQYYDTGRLMAEGRYENGMRSGEYKKYYPNGRMWASGKYQDGLKESTWQYGNENGTLGQMVVYRAGKEVKQVRMNGTFTDWFEAERPRKIENYKNGELHGSYTEYHDNGRWKYEEVDNRRRGGDVEMYRVLEGQTIAVKANYKEGKLHGTYEEFDEKGKLLVKKEYVNGELQP
ncbi:MAG: toxin-antitoxin system YwqK family antitoxin [Cryomorphaceae bacterium]|nr:MAG: toxin-antitoxin system YwqK family antitoxin [Cryomorphaceae bacterium]